MVDAVVVSYKKDSMSYLGRRDMDANSEERNPRFLPATSSRANLLPLRHERQKLRALVFYDCYVFNRMLLPSQLYSRLWSLRGKAYSQCILTCSHDVTMPRLRLEEASSA